MIKFNIYFCFNQKAIGLLFASTSALGYQTKLVVSESGSTIHALRQRVLSSFVNDPNSLSQHIMQNYSGSLPKINIWYSQCSRQDQYRNFYCNKLLGQQGRLKVHIGICFLFYRIIWVISAFLFSNPTFLHLRHWPHFALIISWFLFCCFL